MRESENVRVLSKMSEYIVLVPRNIHRFPSAITDFGDLVGMENSPEKEDEYSEPIVKL